MGTKTANVKVGTLVWRWQDNNGKSHKFAMPKSYCVPKCNARLLSPQHWAKTMKDTKLIEGTGCTTTSRSVQLWWKQKYHKLDVPLPKTTSIATFRSTPGHSRYTNFCNEEAISFKDEDSNPQISHSTVMADEDDPFPYDSTLINKRTSNNNIRLQFDM